MKSKTFELVCLILGTFIGAGFVGGKEIAIYFAKFGYLSIPLSFLLFFLMYQFVKICMSIGSKYCNNVINVSNNNKKISQLLNIIIVISLVINISAMIAGVSSISNIFGNRITRFLLPFIFIILTYLVVLKKINGLKIVNIFSVPILIGLVLFITINSLLQPSGLTLVITDLFFASIGGVISTIIYILFNMLLLGILLIEVGGKYSEREINNASLLSSGIISFCVLLISLSIIFADKSIYLSELPLLAECINISSLLTYIFAVCQMLGIFTTLISSTYLCANLINSRISNYKLACFVSLVVGWLLSLVGYENIVNYLYKVIGLCSFVYFAILFVRIGNGKSKINISIKS